MSSVDEGPCCLPCCKPFALPPSLPHHLVPQAQGRQLTFLANVDPVDAVRALHALDPATTLAVIVR
jgi:glucose-6-phosphate isomerase